MILYLQAFFFVELKKIQVYKSSIYIYIYIIKPRENPIRFQIGIKLESDFTPCVPSNLSF